MSHVEKIRSALSPEASRTFYGMVNTFGMREDDDRLVVLAAVSMLMERVIGMTERLEEFVPALLDVPGKIESAIQRGVNSADATVSESVERSIAVSLDTMTTEVRKLVRELVIGEMTTAATLRTQAIQHEAEGLRRAAEAVASERGGTGAGAAEGSHGGAGAGDMLRWAWGLGGAAIGAMLILVVEVLHRVPVHH